MSLFSSYFTNKHFWINSDFKKESLHLEKYEPKIENPEILLDFPRIIDT